MSAPIASKWILAFLILVVAGCKKGEGSNLPFQTVGRQPDVAPVMLNKELPFRYPPALYAQKVQGNVTLRIYIDSNGAIVADSTRVAETSGFSALDSASKGSADKLSGAAVAGWITLAKASGPSKRPVMPNPRTLSQYRPRKMDIRGRALQRTLSDPGAEEAAKPNRMNGTTKGATM